MKKIISLLLVLAMVSLMAISAGASSFTRKDNKNQCVEVLSMTEGTEEFNVYNMYHLKEPKLMEILATAEEGVLPEDAEIKHLNMIRQRDVVNEEEGPIEVSLHTWGPERYLVVVFKPVDSDEWSVVACDFGNYVDATLPGNGQYAIAWSW